MVSWKDRLKNLFAAGDAPDAAAFEPLLYEADLSPALVARALAGLASGSGTPQERMLAALCAAAGEESTARGVFESQPNPKAILLVGVNGAGKTTTAAKFAARYQSRGLPVVLAAADTFRAGATEQLETWGQRLGVEVVSGAAGSDPAAVVHRAWARARARGALLIADTSGRLHTKVPLMEQLKKIARVLQKDAAETPVATLVALDGTQGQNARAQAAEFAKAAPLDGIVLTKMDGSSRGGFALTLAAEAKLPVWFVGIGEKPADLIEFKMEPFVRLLLDL